MRSRSASVCVSPAPGTAPPPPPPRATASRIRAAARPPPRGRSAAASPARAASSSDDRRAGIRWESAWRRSRSARSPRMRRAGPGESRNSVGVARMWSFLLGPCGVLEHVYDLELIVSGESASLQAREAAHGERGAGRAARDVEPEADHLVVGRRGAAGSGRRRLRLGISVASRRPGGCGRSEAEPQSSCSARGSASSGLRGHAVETTGIRPG